MADSDKDILITPNTGASAEPTIEFTGADNTPLTLRVLDDGTVSFEGTAGQLFSIADGLSGTIFSVNDISGIPSIEVLDDGTVKLAEYGGNVGIGKSSPTTPLDVDGTVTATNLLPPTDNTGVVGNASYTWSNGQFTNLTVDSTLSVRAAIDLADSDQIRFGNSDDARIFYDGSNNDLEIELEGACDSLRITDNGTSRIIMNKTGHMTVVSEDAVNTRGVRNTYHSTSGPSGGSNGDIWLQYS